MESMKIWIEQMRKGLRKLSDRVDDGLDQIDTFRVAGAQDRINERLD
jgi:hypothetical protein